MTDEADGTFGEALEMQLRTATSGVRSETSGDTSASLDELLDVADLLWEAAHGAPDLDSDPTAAMLGLVPDAEYALDSRALKRLRSNAQVKPSQLASRLRDRGWQIETRDVVRWETKNSSDASPALIKAIASVLGVEADSLAASPGHAENELRRPDWAATLKFSNLVDRWAAVRGVSVAMSRSSLEARVAATVHRGSSPDDRQVLQSLEALVRALEESRGRSDDS